MNAATLLQIINLLGLCGLGWLIYTLKNAVDAQKNTIEAQKAQIESTASIVNMLDAPAMAARVEAFKKFAETERDSIIKASERNFEEEKKILTESNAKLEDKLAQLLAQHKEQGILYYEAAGYMAASFKLYPQLWEVQRDMLTAKLRNLIADIMRVTPDWFTDSLREKMTQSGEVGQKRS
jgi:hypothetical protein